ncbi:hypothetical protein IEQ34_010105 [Dendrobium chrysotoxum]|uniref:DRBM domain-containing protein n=1 Tax=Dendrobium chrysotoxum TaxID=161865 RepID=A0AAV7H4V8_DENCH|nr:hypothetical protein IEQ34_010105 [Dendrobium chrysotoxum]
MKEEPMLHSYSAVNPKASVCVKVTFMNMHKIHLQEYAQRSGISLSSYSTDNAGEEHAPKRRSCTKVSGYNFDKWDLLLLVHFQLALEIIPVKLKNEGFRKLCKLILNKYWAKMKKDRPTYTTTQQDGLLPKFTTAITFDGKTYVGFAGRSKKEGEHNAACVVIESILALLEMFGIFFATHSNTVSVMAQIIGKKDGLFENGVIEGAELVTVASNETVFEFAAKNILNISNSA